MLIYQLHLLLVHIRQPSLLLFHLSLIILHYSCYTLCLWSGCCQGRQYALETTLISFLLVQYLLGNNICCWWLLLFSEQPRNVVRT